MLDFSDFTTEAILDDMLTQVDDSFDTGEGSIIGTALGPVAWYLEGVYEELTQVQENAYAPTAVGESLDLIAEGRGLTRKPAVAAVRKGTFNLAIDPGSRFSTINGEESLVFDVGDLISGSDTTWIYQMTCETPGAEGNAYTGDLLPITNIDGLTSATIGDVIVPGTDEETDDALRQRYEESFQTPAFGGNISAYRSEILSIAGVGAVQVYPAWQGGGTVLCSILAPDYTPASPTVVEQVQNIICPPAEGENTPSSLGFGFAPIGAAVTIKTAESVTVDISAKIETDPSSSSIASDYEPEITANIQAYIDNVNAGWGNMLKGFSIQYPVTIYIARIIAAIITVDGIVNVSNVTINGAANDLHLTETAQLQQVAVLGEVSIT